MKKKISILIFFLLCAIISFAQFTPNPQGTAQQITQFRGAVTGLRGIVITPNDTTNNPATPYYGALTVLPSDAGKDTIPVWMSNGVHWIMISGPGGGAFVRNDTLFAELPAFFDSLTRAPSTILKILRGNGIVSGGTVTVDSCRKLNIVPTIISLNYLQYSSAADTLTVPPSDGTFPRTDEVVDSLGTIVLKVGVPSATPVGQPINPATEVLLASYTIAAGASCLSITQIIVWDENLGTPTEWGLTTAGTISANGNNTDQPFHLTKAIFVSTYTTGSSLIFTYSSPLTAQATELLKFWVYLNGAFGVNQFQIQFFNGSALVGNPIAFNAGYGFNPNDSNFYQQVVAPFSAFGITTEQFDKMVITFYGNDLSGAKGLYLDYIQLQQGNSTPSTQLILTTIGSNGPSTYNSVTNVLNIPEYAGGSNPFDWSVYDSLSTPTVAPFDGATYLVGTSPTGAFIGHANQIATFDSTSATYSFQNAAVGDLLYNAGLYVVDRWNGTNWIQVPPPTSVNWWSNRDFNNVPGQFIKIGNNPSYGSLSNGNTSYGFQTFFWDPTNLLNAGGNTAIGTGSQYYNTGYNNTSIGNYTLWYGMLGHDNLVGGFHAGQNNLVGDSFAIAFGRDALIGSRQLYISDSTTKFHFNLQTNGGTPTYMAGIDGSGNWWAYPVPGGGGGSGGNNMYNIDSSLASNRTVDLNGKYFKMQYLGADVISISQIADAIQLRAYQSQDNGNVSTLNLETDFDKALWQIDANFNDNTKRARIVATTNATVSDISLSADTHTFNGTIVYNTPPSGGPTDSVIVINPTTGVLGMRDAASFVITADNGLTKTLGNVQLGGALTGNTTIAKANSEFIVNGRGNITLNAEEATSGTSYARVSINADNGNAPIVEFALNDNVDNANADFSIQGGGGMTFTGIDLAGDFRTDLTQSTGSYILTTQKPIAGNLSSISMFLAQGGNPGTITLSTARTGADANDIMVNDDNTSIVVNNRSNTTTDAATVVTLRRGGVSPVDNYGESIDYILGTDVSAVTSTQLISRLTDVTDGTATSEFSIVGLLNATPTLLLTISGAGIFTLLQGLPSYANNAAALIGGLTSGQLYRISIAGTSTVAIVE